MVDWVWRVQNTPSIALSPRALSGGLDREPTMMRKTELTLLVNSVVRNVLEGLVSFWWR